MRLYAFDNRIPQRAYRLDVTPAWAQRHDNGHLISIGLEIPADLSERSLAALVKRKRATEVSVDEANHGGCQSSCTLRGAERCSW